METLGFVLLVAFNGLMPIKAVLKRVDEVARRASGSSKLDVAVLRFRAELEAMQGDIETARRLIAEARALARELGLTTTLASAIAHSAGEIELLAGDPAAAEREFRPGCEALEQIGDWGHFATLVPYLADALLQQSRGEDAAQMIDLAARWALEDDADAQIGWRRVRARLLAQQGDLADAEVLAREAAERAARTDYLNVRGRTLGDLGEVLALAGRPDEAADALEQAVALYERKGNVVMAERTRTRLAELQDAARR
jgi:tetratricopeptide (TPR) repeat protein